MSDLLVAQRLRKSYDSLAVVDDLSFRVQEGEILGLMGPNGAGKTTLFGLLSGTVPADSGRIFFRGRDITGLPAFRRCRMGLGRTYQIPRPFGRMTVFENLLVAAVHGGRSREGHARGEVLQLLELTGLSDNKDLVAGRLALNERKRLELARALAAHPRLLLLDEIAGGLAEGEVAGLLQIIRDIRRRGVTIVMTEHLLSLMNEAVDRLLVIAEGRRVNCGPPGAVMSSEDVIACYLGTEDE
jgi:branched-chain amino acid transport system ATP-binding protein